MLDMPLAQKEKQFKVFKTVKVFQGKICTDPPTLQFWM